MGSIAVSPLSVDTEAPTPRTLCSFFPSPLSPPPRTPWFGSPLDPRPYLSASPTSPPPTWGRCPSWRPPAFRSSRCLCSSSPWPEIATRCGAPRPSMLSGFLFPPPYPHPPPLPHAVGVLCTRGWHLLTCCAPWPPLRVSNPGPGGEHLEPSWRPVASIQQQPGGGRAPGYHGLLWPQRAPQPPPIMAPSSPTPRSNRTRANVIVRPLLC
jgi:hypothetical protein